jgi:SAM-dependent methyltransferase
VRFAYPVGPKGRVLAVDIDPKLLEGVRQRAADLKLENVETVLAAPDDPKLPAGSVDVVFICDVIHHIENRPVYYKLLGKALKPGGRLAIVDFHKRPMPVGPSIERNEDRARGSDPRGHRERLPAGGRVHDTAAPVFLDFRGEVAACGFLIPALAN